MESRFIHNQEIVVNFGKAGILIGKITAIKFTESKVLYDVDVYPFPEIEYKNQSQKLTNIDSYYIELPEDRFNGMSNIGIIKTDN